MDRTVYLLAAQPGPEGWSCQGGAREEDHPPEYDTCPICGASVLVLARNLSGCTCWSVEIGACPDCGWGGMTV